MRTSRWTIIPSLIMASIFGTPARGEIASYPNASFPSANGPAVGALNYVEGQASISGRTLSPKSVGSVELKKGQSLTTQSGKAEILLTPGVFLRAADNSSALMISRSMAPTVVELAKGRAMVEVTYIRKENDIRVDEDGASIKLLKKGLYDFDADSSQVRVFKGRASVYVGNRKINLMQKEEVTLNSGVKPKAKYFKTAQYEDDFYDWCRLRSEDMLEANAALATQYGANYGPNWYWDPWFGAWAFPFDWGWGYYSPFFGYDAPFFYGRPFGGGFYGRPFGPGRSGPGGFGGVHGGGFGGHGGGGFQGGGRR